MEITKRELRELIGALLREDAYKRARGARYTGDIDAVRSTLNKDGYFLHFSDVPKIGVNPGSAFLPGTYFYPNIKPIFDAFVADVSGTARGQARAARYVFLVKLKPGVNILEGADAIAEAAEGNIRAIVQPILDADLNDWIAREGGADVKRNASYFLGGVAPFIDHAYPSLLQLEEMGLMDHIESRERASTETIGMLRSILAELSSPAAKDSSARGWEAFKPVLSAAVAAERALEPKFTKRTTPYRVDEWSASQNPDRGRKDFMKHIKTKIEDLKTSLTRSELSGVDFESMLRGGYIASSGGYEPFSSALKEVGTILRSTAMLKELASLFLESPLQKTSKLFSMLKRMKSQEFKILSKSSGIISSSDLADRCFAAAADALGESNYKRLLGALAKGDSVGVNLILILGSQYAGVNDTTSLPPEVYEELKSSPGGGVRFLSGDLGVISRYESAQLFLRAPLGDKIEVVTMIDRFEGMPPEYLPGSSTPDTEYDTEETPRARALKTRFFRNDSDPADTPEVGPVRRERWSEK